MSPHEAQGTGGHRRRDWIVGPYTYWAERRQFKVFLYQPIRVPVATRPFIGCYVRGDDPVWVNPCRNVEVTHVRPCRPGMADEKNEV